MTIESLVMTEAKSKEKTILVVDDDDAIREALTDVLSLEGYSVVTAANGEEGIRRMKETHPDLILLDVRMPVMDGWEFKKEMDADAEFAATPVLVFCAFSGPPPGLNVQGIIPKPISIKIILDSIRHHIKDRP